jgi:hypothetical protein
MVIQHGRLLEVKRDTYNGNPSNSVRVGERFTSESGQTIERGVYIDLDSRLTAQEVQAWERLVGEVVTVGYRETAKMSKAGKAYISRWSAQLVNIAELDEVELAAA